MSHTCVYTTFSEAYPDLVRQHQKRLFVFTGFMIGILLVIVWQIKHAVLEDQLVIALSIILWTACMFAWFMFIVPYRGKIVGKDGMITIIDQRHTLKPGEGIRLWYYPREVQLIPLEGLESVDFAVTDLQQFHDLHEWIPGIDLSNGTYHLSVAVHFSWTILPAADMDRYYFQSSGMFQSTIAALLRNKFMESLHVLCDNGPAFHAHAGEPQFSEILEDMLSEKVSAWKGVTDHPLPYHVDVQSLKIELVHATTTRTAL